MSFDDFCELLNEGDRTCKRLFEILLKDTHNKYKRTVQNQRKAARVAPMHLEEEGNAAVSSSENQNIRRISLGSWVWNDSDSSEENETSNASSRRSSLSVINEAFRLFPRAHRNRVAGAGAGRTVTGLLSEMSDDGQESVENTISGLLTVFRSGNSNPQQ
jgi:hypothetical protein